MPDRASSGIEKLSSPLPPVLELQPFQTSYDTADQNEILLRCVLARYALQPRGVWMIDWQTSGNRTSIGVSRIVAQSAEGCRAL